MARQRPWYRDDFGLFRQLQTGMPQKDIVTCLSGPALLALFDLAINGWLIELELIDPKGTRMTGLLAQSSCSFFEVLSTGDKIVAGIRVAHVGTSSVAYEVAMFNGEAERSAAQGNFVHVYVEPATRTPQALSQAFRVTLGDYIK